MLFKKNKKKFDVKRIESFDPSLCKMEKFKHVTFSKDDVAMGCSDGCWDGCIGTCRRFQH